MKTIEIIIFTIQNILNLICIEIGLVSLIYVFKHDCSEEIDCICCTIGTLLIVYGLNKIIEIIKKYLKK